MSERRGATRGDSRSLWLVLGVFAAAVVAINPVREVITDDDFAYALMVKHLAATGEYRLHDWAAANMPVQIYWARLLSGLFGFSFTTLRASTLILLTIAIVALYGVVRDRRASDAEAGLMTLVFLANPLVLFLGFTFMTDVQFLGWMTLALWCYLRALHGGSWRAMAAGAISAAAAVGTRQFGIALPAGLALTWLLDRDRRHSWGLYGLGVGPPAIAGLWQIFGGMTHPSFSQRLRLHEQAAYVGSLGNFILEAVWRPTVISQYLAVFLSPLVPVILWSVYRSWRRPERAPLLSGEPPAGSLSRTLLFAALTGYIAAGVMFGWLERGLLMPSLLFYFSRVLGPVLVFYLSSLPHSTSWIRVSVTLGSAVVGILVVWSLWAAARTRADGRHPSPAELFPLVTILCFLGLQVLYVQFADEYLLPFVPLVMSVALWPFGDVSMWMKRVTVALCLAGLALGILWTRGTLERAQAYWEAAEYLRSGGVEPRSIRAFPAMWVWNSYYGAFDEWVSEIHGSESIKIGRYHEFLGMRAGSGPYRIEETDRLGDERLLTTRCYRSYLLEKRCVNVFQRLP